jgi:hypothetical protein
MAIKWDNRTLAVLLLLFAGICAGAGAPEIPALRDGVAVQEVIPADANGRPVIKRYTYSVPEKSVLELTMQLTPGARQAFPVFIVHIMSGRKIHEYHLDMSLPTYLYYPVLDKGTYDLYVRSNTASAPYTLQLRRLEVNVTEPDITAAKNAIDKGMASLAAVSPAQARSVALYAPAIESFVMAALDSDPAQAHKDRIAKDYLPWLKAQLPEIPNVQWKGKPVAGVIRGNASMYDTAIATLALAEMAPRNSDAKALAEQTARFILAAQVTDQRPAEWRTPPKTSPFYGGWRYFPQSLDADLSVSGWCIIALNACAVADIQPEGMRDALADAVKFVRKTQAADGFGYEINGGGGSGPIRNAIGGLVFQLYGEHGRENDAGLAFLDRHLYAGTQTDDFDSDYPLYYAYYATRLHYLRGSFAWEAWRMTTLRQLVKLQQADGSWAPGRKETVAGATRYSTALSILILRMCLNDQPAYMTQEVKGF